MLVLTEIVELPDPVTEVGLKLALAPLGRPLTLKATAPVNPPDAVTVAVYEVPAPAVTVCDAGEAVMEKLGPDGGGKVTQLFAAFENSNWIVYAVPFAVYEACWPLQMSPISPLTMSYQASGGAKVVAMPTSASVIASVNSWLVTDV